MAHKNDYSVVVFFPDFTPKKWQFVHRLNTMANHLNEKHPSWIYMNIYNRREGRFIKRFYKEDVIPEFVE
ncbi:MAG: hypothetical protein JWO44_1008 [Bacteroidetes bacterium]|nr:hypothetical protein [Bacteroidota bacterium]